MKRKVKVTRLPRAKSGGDITKITRHRGFQTPPRDAFADPGSGRVGHPRNTPDIKINRTLKPTSPENATLEAELGETVVTNLMGEGIPEFYKIGGKKHSRGGTPLNLPKNSFIFSNNRALKIKDPTLLEFFGWTGKKNPTFADVSKKFDLNKYREILANPHTDKMQKETAEGMIKNFNLKLGALALAQESQKGFDRGIPAIAIPYMESIALTPDDLFPSKEIDPSMLPGYAGGGELPSFQPGGESKGEPVTTGKPTKVQNIPKGAVRWDPAKDGYNEEEVEPGDYMKEDGRWVKVIGFQPKPYAGDATDPRLGQFNDDYYTLEGKFEDSDFKEGFVEYYRKVINDAKPGKHLSKQDLIDARAMSDEEIKDLFLYKQKQNFAVHTLIKSLDEDSKTGDPKKDWDKNRKRAIEMGEKAGFPALNTAQIAAFQAAYIGLNEMSKDPKYKDDLRDFALIQAGKGDEKIAGNKPGTISSVDGWDGDTTSGQLAVRANVALNTEEVPWTELPAEQTPVDVTPMPPEVQNRTAPKWWTQDINNIGTAFSDLMGLKKYDPWQDTPEFREASPTFTDFRGTAARINSMAGIGARHARAIADPQAFAAIFANIQRGSVDPILQTQEAENRTNVGVANQFELANTQMHNANERVRSGLSTQLYDKQVAANQAFDNAKRAFKHGLVNSFNTGWGNRGKTATMNDMFPEYAVDPASGILFHTPTNEPIEPTNAATTTFSDQVSRLKQENPGISWEAAIKMARGNAGLPINEGLPVGVSADQLGYPG